MIVPGDDSLVTVLTTNLNICQPLWDDQFLLIGSFLHIDDLMVLHKRTAHLYGFGHITELPSTIS